MPLPAYYKEVEGKMKKAVECLHKELSAVRTGVAQISLVDHIVVAAYGSQMPLNQLATISTPEPRTLVIQPWDVSMLSAVEKAIMTSDLGLMPNNDGKIVRINIPQLSEERRGELIKVVKAKAEDERVVIRNIRRDANEHIKKMQKNKEITEDLERDAFDHVQKMTDEYIEEIGKALKHKEEELMEV